MPGGRPQRELDAINERLQPIGAKAAISGMRGNGLTYQRIADELRAKTGIGVSDRTISNWLGSWASQEKGGHAA